MRRDSKVRRGNVVAAALELAVELHYNRVTRLMVAGRLEVPVGEVRKLFSTTLALRTAVVRAAIAKRNLVVVGQALHNGHPLAEKAPEALRSAAWPEMTYKWGGK